MPWLPAVSLLKCFSFVFGLLCVFVLTELWASFDCQTPTRIFQFLPASAPPGCWNTSFRSYPPGTTGVPGCQRMRLFTAPEVTQTFHQYPLITPGGNVTINAYGVKDYISRIIAETGQWEAPIIAKAASLFSADPELQFIDIGTNIGVYAVAAAKLGRRVIAVDANMMNVLRLRKSLLTAGLQDKVKIVWNAIDTKYTSVLMQYFPDNIGRNFIVDKNNKNAKNGTDVNTISMDDLLRVIDFKKAIMKLDIEGKEYDGLHNASRLFSEIDIPIVFMEWEVIQLNYLGSGDPKIPAFIINFFTSRDYIGVLDPYSSQPLSVDYKTWPLNIVWRKKSFTIKKNKAA